jgi:hypothetical protein
VNYHMLSSIEPISSVFEAKALHTKHHKTRSTTSTSQ